MFLSHSGTQGESGFGIRPRSKSTCKTLDSLLVRTPHPAPCVIRLFGRAAVTHFVSLCQVHSMSRLRCRTETLEITFTQETLNHTRNKKLAATLKKKPSAHSIQNGKSTLVREDKAEGAMRTAHFSRLMRFL